jgi:hypothetical protein
MQKLLDKEVDEMVIEIFTSKVGITSSDLDLEHKDLQHVGKTKLKQWIKYEPG